MPIKFEDVSYIYNEKSPFSQDALKDINLEFYKDKFTAIVGRTGSGKSTLVQHLNALLNPTKGKVIIDDFINSSNKKERTKKTSSLRMKVGMVFQFPEYQLFEKDVETDVSFGPRNFGFSKEEALKMAHDALKVVGLDESFYKRSPFTLSGGEKRKVAIAGVLASDPKILVIDEPTSGLDPEAGENLMNLFRDYFKQGKAVFLVTHDMDLVLKYADRVIVMEDGMVAFDGTPGDLFQKDLASFSLAKPTLFSFMEKLKERGIDLPFETYKTPLELAKALKEKQDE